MISYNEFWLTCDCSDISTYALIKKHGISANTLNRMKHGKPISTVTIDKLCKALNCMVDDIISYEPDEPREPKVPPCQNVDNK